MKTILKLKHITSGKPGEPVSRDQPYGRLGGGWQCRNSELDRIYKVDSHCFIWASTKVSLLDQVNGFNSRKLNPFLMMAILPCRQKPMALSAVLTGRTVLSADMYSYGTKKCWVKRP